MDSGDLLGVLNARFALYSFFSRAFDHEPDEGMLALLNSHELDDVVGSFEGSDDMLLQARTASQASNALSLLRDEYTKLFLGPEKLPVPIWESVYFSEERLLFTKTTLSVRQAYRASGFITQGYPHMADDHIATELSFLSVLSKRQCEALASADYQVVLALLKAQSSFIENHLGRWVSRFSKGLEQLEGISAFYPALASLTSSFVSEDGNAIHELNDMCQQLDQSR